MRDSEVIPINLGLAQEEFLQVCCNPDGSDKLTIVVQTKRKAEKARRALANGRPDGDFQPKPRDSAAHEHVPTG
jgi:hypothetical protein